MGAYGRPDDFKRWFEKDDVNTDDIVFAYRDGESAESIGKRYGVGQTSVLRLLGDLGVSRRHPKVHLARISRERSLSSKGQN